jgi:hypothetical protein
VAWERDPASLDRYGAEARQLSQAAS